MKLVSLYGINEIFCKTQVLHDKYINIFTKPLYFCNWNYSNLLYNKQRHEKLNDSYVILAVMVILQRCMREEARDFRKHVMKKKLLPILQYY